MLQAYKNTEIVFFFAFSRSMKLYRGTMNDMDAFMGALTEIVEYILGTLVKIFRICFCSLLFKSFCEKKKHTHGHTLVVIVFLSYLLC